MIRFFKFTIVDLTKYDYNKDGLDSRKNRWVYFMKNAANFRTDTEIRHELIADEVFQKALLKLYRMSLSSKVRKEYEEGKRDSLELLVICRRCYC